MTEKKSEAFDFSINLFSEVTLKASLLLFFSISCDDWNTDSGDGAVVLVFGDG